MGSLPFPHPFMSLHHPSEEELPDCERSSELFGVLRRIGANIRSLFAPQPVARRRPRSCLSIEHLEARTLLSATPAAIATINTETTAEVGAMLDAFGDLDAQYQTLESMSSRENVLFDGTNWKDSFTVMGPVTFGTNSARLGTNAELILKTPYDLSQGAVKISLDVFVARQYDIAEVLTQATNALTLRGGGGHGRVHVSTYNQLIMNAAGRTDYVLRRPGVAAGQTYHVEITESLTQMDIRVTGNGFDERSTIVNAAKPEQKYLRLWSKYDNTFANLRMTQERSYDPSAELATIDDHIELVSDDVLDLLAEAAPRSTEVREPLRDPRMLVSVPTAAGLNVNPVTIRYRSPHDQTYFEFTQSATRTQPRVMHSAIIDHRGGATDAVHEFAFDVRPYNYRDSAWELVMWSDPQKTTMLDRVCGWSTTSTSMQQVRISTEQNAWQDVDAGLLDAHPISPDLALLKTDGPNVQLLVRSPYDTSVVSIDGGGLLSYATMEHEGGTPFTVTQVTINGALQSGTYAVTLFDRSDGRILDQVRLYWDRDAKRLSAAAGETPWQPEDMATMLESMPVPLTGNAGEDAMRTLEHEAYIETAKEQYAAMMSGTRTLRTTFLSSSALRTQQETLLYEQSAFFLPIETATWQYFFQRFPHYHPDNFDAFIDSEYARRPTYSRGQIQDSAVKNRLRDLHEVSDGLAAYAEISGQVLQSAVEVFVAVENGLPQEPKIDLVRQIHARFGNQKIGALIRIGIAIPSADAFIAEAKKMLESERTQRLLAHFQQEDDKIDVKAQQMVWAHINDLQARAQLLAEKGKNYDIVQPTVEEAKARQEVIAAKTQALREKTAVDRAIARADDPSIARAARLVEAAMNAGTAPVFRIAVSDDANVQRLRSVENGGVDVTMTVPELLALRERLINIEVGSINAVTAMSEADDIIRSATEVASAQDFVNLLKGIVGAPEEDLTFGSDIENYLQSEAGEALMQLMRLQIPAFHRSITEAYDPSGEIFPIAVRTDSTAALLLRSLYQGFHLTRNGNTWKGETRESLIVKASALTGMPVSELFAIGSGNDALLARNLKRMFEAKGLDLDPSAMLGSVATDGVVRSDGTIRVFYDVPPSAKSREVRLTVMAIDGRTIADVTSYSDRLYVDIGLAQSETMRVMLSDTFAPQTSVVASSWFTPRQAMTLSLQPNTHDYSTLSETSENQLRRKIENIALNALADNFVLANQTSWTWLISSDKHTNAAYHAIDLSNGTDKAPIYLPFDGKVVLNRVDSGGNPTIVFEHIAEVNGEIHHWYTKYLHQYADASTGLSGPVAVNGTVTGFAVGAEVKAGTHILNMGNFGQSSGPHLHLEVLMNPDGNRITDGNYYSGNLVGIDPRKVLTRGIGGASMRVEAATIANGTRNGPQQSVLWDDNIDAWVTTDRSLILNRNELLAGNEGDNSYWLAYHDDPSQRRRVTWVTVSNVKRQDGSVGDVALWIPKDEVTNPLQYWNADRKQFIEIPRL